MAGSALWKTCHVGTGSIYEQGENVKLENLPVRTVSLSKMWYDFLITTNRVEALEARKNKGQASINVENFGVCPEWR